jgi:hypothetical protein
MKGTSSLASWCRIRKGKKKLETPDCHNFNASPTLFVFRVANGIYGPASRLSGARHVSAIGGCLKLRSRPLFATSIIEASRNYKGSLILGNSLRRNLKGQNLEGELPRIKSCHSVCHLFTGIRFIKNGSTENRRGNQIRNFRVAEEN